MEFNYKTRREWEECSPEICRDGNGREWLSKPVLETLAGYKILQKGWKRSGCSGGHGQHIERRGAHSVGLGGDAFALIYLAKERN